MFAAWVKMGPSSVCFLLQSHPSRLSQSPRLNSLSKFRLAICFTYGSVYVFTPLPQFTLLSPFPLGPQVCPLCLCLYCCCYLVPKSFWLIATPWIVASQVPLSMEFPRQEYWSGFPCTSSEDLLDPGIEPGSPAWQAVSLPLSIAAL